MNMETNCLKSYISKCLSILLLSYNFLYIEIPIIGKFFNKTASVSEAKLPTSVSEVTQDQRNFRMERKEL